MIRLLSVAIAAAMTAASATAAPVDNGIAFNGPFAGLQGGWQQDRVRSFSIDQTGNGAYGRETGSGFAYGGQVGYDYRLRSNLVIGGEAAVTGRTGQNNLFDTSGAYESVRFGRTVDVTGRLGYVLPSTGGLAYVRGGYSNTRLLLTDAVARNGYNRDGYTVGVGYEQPIARRVSARLEYDYSGYGRDQATGTAIDYGYAGSSTRLHRNAVTAGLNFHF